MPGRLLRTLIGAALFLAGYGLQEGTVEPFAGVADPRFLGLLLEGLGLVLLLSPLLGRRRLPEPTFPRIRKELVRKPRDDEEEEPPAPPGPDGKGRKDEKDGG